MRRIGLVGASFVAVMMFSTVVQAATDCRNTGSFKKWLAEFKREAIAEGIQRHTIDQGLAGVAYDPKIIARDRRQGVFAQTFLKFSDRMVSGYRLKRGATLRRKYARVFADVKQRYGVPAPVILAFWALETDFGAFIGDMPTLNSLATMAYDCRRPDLFRKQLMAALRIIDRGDLRADEMVGPWAGELGQTQFLPSHYYDFAVDYDGDGRRDLLNSVPDVLASTANYLNSLGWKRNQPWIEEVRVPASMPWEQSSLAIKLPRSQWAQWGITRANGKALRADQMRASLLLPMGRNGPAFLSYANFDIYLEWNKSLTYGITAGYLATRFAGAGRVSRGRAEVKSLSLSQTKRLQRLLVRRGYDVGKIDGIIGARTRDAVKAVQIKLGLPPDSYPTPDLLAML
jgi:lytic murein transglycosylase